MIRRDPTPETSRRWILISQIDHARLAGQLAEHWDAPGFAPLVPRAELLWAIYHHDDGWREWEQALQVDPRSGRPRSFMEMPASDALTIWNASIAAAADAGNLQAYVVAGHFATLARRATAWRNDASDALKTEQFIADCNQRMAVWQQAWQAENPAINVPELAARGLRFLQFFDALSLWFCCAEAHEPHQSATPDGPPVTFTPITPERLALAPWPLAVERLELELVARAVPAERYASAAELAAAPSQPALLHWQLQPDAQES